MDKREWINEFYSYGAVVKYTPEQNELLNKNAKNALYQYRSFNSHDLENIKNGVIWASSVERFNDPYDCDFNVALMMKWSEEILKKYPTKEMKEWIRTTTNMMLELRRSTAVSCFSEECDSILMWSHYANNHKGICLCYDPFEILEAGKMLFPVWYRKKKTNPYILTEENRIEINKNIKEIFIQKSLEWSYEREWRLIEMVEEGKETEKLIRNKGVMIKGVFPKRIILGAKIPNDERKDELIEVAKSKGINVTQMKLCDDEYKLIET